MKSQKIPKKFCDDIVDIEFKQLHDVEKKWKQKLC